LFVTKKTLAAAGDSTDFRLSPFFLLLIGKQNPADEAQQKRKRKESGNKIFFMG